MALPNQCGSPIVRLFGARLRPFFIRLAKVRESFLHVFLVFWVFVNGWWFNRDVTRCDQDSYINYARSLFESHYEFVGDRNRMPLFPCILSLGGWMGVRDWFFFGKIVSAVIAGGVGFGLWLWLRKLFGKREGGIVWFALWGGAIALRAFYVQADVLAVGLIVAAWGLVRKPDGGIHRLALAGLLTGAAYLTKASFLPFTAIVFLMLLTDEKYGGWMRLARGGAYLASAFIPMVDYLANSKIKYGEWLYNVNSRFYFWYDSWAEVRRGTRAFGDRGGWPTMPEADIPSLSWYFNRHDLWDVLWRLFYGGVINLCVLGLFAALILWTVPVLALRRNMFNSRRAVLFATLVALYFALTSWWMPIAIGTRFFTPILIIALIELWGRVRGTVDAEEFHGGNVCYFLIVWPFIAMLSLAGE